MVRCNSYRQGWAKPVFSKRFLTILKTIFKILKRLQDDFLNFNAPNKKKVFKFFVFKKISVMKYQNEFSLPKRFLSVFNSMFPFSKSKRFFPFSSSKRCFCFQSQNDFSVFKVITIFPFSSSKRLFRFQRKSVSKIFLEFSQINMEAQHFNHF